MGDAFQMPILTIGARLHIKGHNCTTGNQRSCALKEERSAVVQGLCIWMVLHMLECLLKDTEVNLRTHNQSINQNARPAMNKT
jgi:hypothetical protein